MKLQFSNFCSENNLTLLLIKKICKSFIHCVGTYGFSLPPEVKRVKYLFLRILSNVWIFALIKEKFLLVEKYLLSEIFFYLWKTSLIVKTLPWSWKTFLVVKNCFGQVSWKCTDVLMISTNIWDGELCTNI